MMIRLKNEIVLYVTFIAFFPYVKACQYKFNEDTCRCSFNGPDFTYCDLWNLQMSNVYQSHGFIDLYGSRKCSGLNLPGPYYSYNDLCPIYLNYGFFSENNQPSTVPTQISVERLQIIKWLDMSNNKIHIAPNFKEMKKLESLNISYNFLSIAQLSNEHELPALTEIDLSHNNITDIQIIEDHHPFTTIKYLNLSHNSLANIPDTAFENLRLLQSIDLSHNVIDNLSDSTFDGIKKLKTLNLGHNKLSHLGNSLFRFTELQVLQLQNNRIEVLKCNEFKKLINLQKLDLNSNLLKSIEKDVFMKMSNILDIDLSYNRLEVIDKLLFSNVTTLKLINLSNNEIKTLTNELFKGNQILMFDITDNALTGPLRKGNFDGLKSIFELHLDHMHITSIENYAFLGLDTIVSLFLNDNEIESLQENSFKALRTLEHLDLSNNRIKKIDFAKDELLRLGELILSNNLLTSINCNDFLGINSLSLLDLSYNNISRLDSDSFVTLNSLIKFQIGNNPIVGSLEQCVFKGLSSLPQLDISGALITHIQNSSFEGMLKLININMSHNRIEELEYNAFNDTGAIDTLDLSYNKLIEFNLNTSQIVSLSILLLDNNLIMSISDKMLFGFVNIKELVVSHNKIEHIANDGLKDQTDLRFLDFSFNYNLMLDVNVLRTCLNLKELILSGLKRNLSLKGLGKIAIDVLDVSSSNIENVKKLHLNDLNNLHNLMLFKNNISELEVGALSGLSSVKFLDLSFNKINYIQPGSFKDNILLTSLNISHNLLTQIPYGIFHGLTLLSYLDVSYNDLNDLKSERLYQLHSLTILVADHNRITSINADDFIGTRLQTLSIGGNPLPCPAVLKLKDDHTPFKVITLKVDHEHENIDGITCNVLKYTDMVPISAINSTDYGNVSNILLNIRDILLENRQKMLSINKDKDNVTVIVDSNLSGIENITSSLEKTLVDNNMKSQNVTRTVAETVNNTNVLLEKMLKVLSKPKTVFNNAPIVKSNATYDNNMLPYINEIKQNIEDDLSEKQDILNDIKKDIALLHSRMENISSSEQLKQEKLIKTQHKPTVSNSAPTFTEVCVALTLLIQVIFFGYIIFKSFILKRSLSNSTRQLPGAIDNSDL